MDRLLPTLTAPLVVAMIVFFAQLPFFDLWFNFMDEGHMLQFADIAARGGEFYRDATFYPLPGAFSFLAIVFEIFGSSIIVARWVVVIEFTLFVVLVFVFLRQLTNGLYAWLGVLAMLLYRIWAFPHWQFYSYSTTSLLVLFSSLLVLLAFLRSGDRRVLGASGLLFGLGVLCKQDYGAAALLTVVMVLVVYARTGRRDARPALLPLLAWFFVPAALVGALTGLHYFRAGVLPDLLQFTVFNHFVGMGEYEYMSFPSLSKLMGQDVSLRSELLLRGFMPGIVDTADWAAVRVHPLFTDTALYGTLLKLFIFTPPIYLAASLLRLIVVRDELAADAAPDARRRYLGELLITIFASSLILLVWLNKPQDYLHLAVLYWPMLCLLLIQLHAWLDGRPRRLVRVMAVATLPAIVLLGYSGRLVLNFYHLHTDLIPVERAGIYAKPTEAVLVEELVDYMLENSAPDDRVAAIPYFPILNFLAERMGPHRAAYIIWPFPEIPDRDQQVVAAMEETGTDLVIYNFTQFTSFSPVWEHAPILFEYLVRNFEIDRVFSLDAWGYKLAGLKRRDPAEQERGERIVAEGAHAVALRVEGDGPSHPVPPESRPAYVREMLWPFRPVIALRPSARGRRTVLSAPVRVPESGARLTSAVAVHPQWWFAFPPSWIDFRLALREGEVRHELFRQRINPTHVLEDRRWFEVDVDLSPWAGREVVVELINEAGSPPGETLWMGGWEVPRLVAPP